MKNDPIAIASDHAGFALKEKIRLHLISQGYSIIDCGTYSKKSVDYPDYIAKAARLVSYNKIKRAIVLCGSGIGASLVANKYPKVRASLVWTPKLAQLSREHNNSNVLVLAGRFLKWGITKKIVKLWLTTPYSHDPRHNRRLQKLRNIEKKFFGFFFFILFFLWSLFLSANTLTWKNKQLLQFKTSNLELQKDSRGYYLSLQHNQPSLNNADLYIDFNRKHISDSMRHYTIKQQNFIQDKNFLFRKTQTAGFLFPENQIRIKTKRKNFLTDQIDLGSFTISLWLYLSPKSESVILQKGIFKNNIFYGINIKKHNNKLYFSFQNFFYDIDNTPHSFSLTTPCTPEQWDNYCVTFDKRTGKLRLLKNNNEEDIKWATENATSESTIFSPHFQGYSDLIIGMTPFGYIDDFVIYKTSFEQSPDYNITKTKSAMLTSPIIEAHTFDATLQSMYINSKKPKTLKVRSSNTLFQTNSFSPEWKQTLPIQGKFFQFQYALNPKTKIYTIQLILNERAILDPPKTFQLIAQDNNLIVQWNPAQDKRVAGYYLYIQSKNDLKKINCHNVTNFTISNLKYNELYSVALSVYDKATPPNESLKSEEKKIMIDK